MAAGATFIYVLYAVVYPLDEVDKALLFGAPIVVGIVAFIGGKKLYDACFPDPWG